MLARRVPAHKGAAVEPIVRLQERPLAVIDLAHLAEYRCRQHHHRLVRELAGGVNGSGVAARTAKLHRSLCLVRGDPFYGVSTAYGSCEICNYLERSFVTGCRCR